MKPSRLIIMLFICLLSLPAISFGGPIRLPPIRVIAPAIDGGSILCQGAGCAAALAALSGAYVFSENLTDHANPSEPLVDRDAFCRNLKRKQPRGCRLGSIPSTPQFDPGWRPNGCGAGPIANAAASAAMRYLFRGFYTLNEPYRGVSFRSACNNHDQCFSSGGGFDKCNSRFSRDMARACSRGTVAGSDARTACGNFATVYRSAVSSTRFGLPAYKNALKALSCAGWHRAMKLNRCL